MILMWRVKYVKSWKLNQINVSLWDIKKNIRYCFYYVVKQKKAVLKHVTFLERKFILERISKRKIEFEEVQELESK